nr:aminoglycoside 6-adenylyltransferase [Eggerthella sinensis]
MARRVRRPRALIEVLLDKDGIAPRLPSASDERFWVQKPTAACVDDCANEFFLSCTYVARGLLRDELLFANGVFDEIVRVELRRMLGYLAGARAGFPLNTGKRDKFLLRFLTEGERADLLATYRLDTVEAAWSALHGAMDLFERAVQETCATLAYPCPVYGAPVEGHIETLKRLGR